MTRPGWCRAGVATRVAAAVVVVPALLATGCQSAQDRYCGTVKDHQSELGDVMGGDPNTALLKALPIFTDLQDKAPSDVQDDWRVVVTAVQALRDALSAAHVDPATYDRDHPPAGVTAKQRAAIDAAAVGLTSPQTVEALDSVQQEALDVCQTPLYL